MPLDGRGTTAGKGICGMSDGILSPNLVAGGDVGYTLGRGSCWAEVFP